MLSLKSLERYFGNKTIEILTFGIITKVYCPKNINLQVNQLISTIDSTGISFITISEQISNLLLQYPIPYDAWLIICNRNAKLLPNYPQYQVFHQIIELFYNNKAHQILIFNYFSEIISDLRYQNGKTKILRCIIDRYLDFPINELLQLSLNLIDILPTYPTICLDESELHPDDNSINLANLVNSDDATFDYNVYLNEIDSEYEEEEEEEESGYFEYEDLDDAPKLDSSYVTSYDITPCKGYPLYVTNIVAKAHSSGSENDTAAIVGESQQIRSVILQLMFDKFEKLVISDNSFASFFTCGTYNRQLLLTLLKVLYTDSYDIFERLFTGETNFLMEKKEMNFKPRKIIFPITLDFSSEILEERRESLRKEIFDNHFEYSLDLDNFLQSVPKFDLFGFRDFATMDDELEIEFKPSIESCTVVEEILRVSPPFKWFFNNILSSIGILRITEYGSTFLLCSNALANCLFIYTKLIKLVDKFMFIKHNNNITFHSIQHEYTNNDVYEQTIRFYKQIVNDRHVNTILKHFFDIDDDEIEIDLRMNERIEDKLPIITENEESYMPGLIHCVEYDTKLFHDSPITEHMLFIRKFFKSFTNAELSPMIEEAVERFGRNSRYFFEFCYEAHKMKTVINMVKYEDQWEEIMELFDKYGIEFSGMKKSIKKNIPKYIAEAREYIQPMVAVEFSVGKDEIKFIPLG